MLIAGIKEIHPSLRYATAVSPRGKVPISPMINLLRTRKNA